MVSAGSISSTLILTHSEAITIIIYLAKGLFFVCSSDSTIALCKPIMWSTCRFHTMSLFNLTKYVIRPNVLKIIIESTHLSLPYNIPLQQ